MKAPLQIIRALLLISGLMLAFPSAYGAEVCSSSPSTSASDTLTDSGGNGGNYSNNEFCDFLIQPTNATTITLSFSAFNLESGFDFLTVYDGSTSGSPVLANNLSGTSLPGSVTSTGGSLLVRFTSDGSVTRSGFISSWTSASTSSNSVICNSSSSTSSSGTLTDSGDTGGNYSDNENCQFLIQPAAGGNITFSFSAFNYENNFDFVRIYDGTTTSSTLLGTFTNTSIPADVIATSESMLVVSTSDGSVTRSGFQATWSTSTGSSCPAESVEDSFSSVSYSQNNGSQNWTGDWTEVGESDGTSAGIARVRSDLCSGGNCLRLGVPSGNSAQTYSNRGVFRETDLSTASSATLSFVYRRGVNQGNQTVVLAISNNGGSSWTSLQSYFMNSSNTSAVSASFDISAYTASNTQIRFLASGNNAVIGMYIDNINISYQPACSPTPVIDHHFDELNWNGTANEVEDSSGNNNHALANAASGLTTISSGQICRAGQFDGSNDYIESSSVFTTLSTTASLSFWVKTTQNGNDINYLAPGITGSEQNGGTDDIFWGWLDATGRIGISVGDDFNSKSTVTINNGVYRHVVLTRDSPTGAYKIYIDGALNNSGTTGSGDIGTSFSSIGRAEGTGQYFQGDLDEVLVFDSILSDAQVNTIYIEQLAGNNYDGSTRTCPAPALDHFSISHSTTAISCLAENITISAHTNASPGHAIETGYTGTISLSTSTSHGDWSWVSGGLASNLTNSGNGVATFVFDGSENGRVILGLSNTFDEVININVNDGGVTETSGVALTTEDENLDFDVAGFRFVESTTENPIGLQIAGKTSNTGYGSQNLVLQAINTNAVTGACEAALSGTETVQVRLECTNPASCQRPLFLGATSPSNTITTTNSGVSLDFGNAADNDADFIMNYPDAGAIQLHAEHTLPNGTIMRGSSNNIIWRPFGFNLTASPNPAAADHTGGVLTAAGSPFTVTATAVLWDSNDDSNNDGIPDNHDDNDPSTRDDLSNNTVTLGGNSYTSAPNFGQENEDVILAAELNQPSGGNNPTLSSSGINAFSNGAGSNSNVIYNEVGIIELSASIDDNDYLGIGSTETQKMLSKSGYVGRFIPASFSITSPLNGEFENAQDSTSGNYTYIGQPFSYGATRPSFILNALNVSGTITQNYTGDFSKLTDSGPDPSIDFTAPNADRTKLGSTGVPMPITYTPDSITLDIPPGNGSFNFTFADDRFVYNRDTNSQVTPFDPTIDLVIASITDSDLVTTGIVNTTLTPVAANAVDPNLRFGRLRMSNVHGSELNALLMPMQIEIYNLTGVFEIHADDVTTQITDANLALLADDQLSTTGASTFTVVNSTAVSGILDVNLSPPGAGIDGYIDVTPDLSAATGANLEWLRYDWSTGTNTFNENPTGKATFGIYQGNEVNIYIQQTYQ